MRLGNFYAHSSFTNLRRKMNAKQEDVFAKLKDYDNVVVIDSNAAPTQDSGSKTPQEPPEKQA